MSVAYKDWFHRLCGSFSFRNDKLPQAETADMFEILRVPDTMCVCMCVYVCVLACIRVFVCICSYADVWFDSISCGFNRCQMTYGAQALSPVCVCVS